MPSRVPLLHHASDLPNHQAILRGAPNYDGIYALSLDINAAWVETAYRRGLFPWYSEGQPVLWHSPDPRMVLKLDHFKCTQSLHKKTKQWAKQPHLGMKVTINQCFEQVITACANTTREGQDGTWITPELKQAYVDLHHQQKAVSVEVWQHDRLVAGLYGVLLGKMFFGESMFTYISDGSKIALACWVKYLKRQGGELIDCQQETSHLTSLGGAPIDRKAFFEQSAALIQQEPFNWSAMQQQTNLLNTLSTPS